MKIAVGFLLMILFTVIANLLLKIGAGKAPSPVLFNFISWISVFGLVCFAGAGLIYSWLLKSLPLSIAQSFAAAQFVAVILASAVVLSESITAAQWLGILLIATGISVVGWSQ